MIGTIIGDILGSVYEFNNIKHTDFQPLIHKEAYFTDDTICSCAVADTLSKWVSGVDCTYEGRMREICRRHQEKGFGKNFSAWVADDSLKAYDSWGNGSAMRVSPVGWMILPEKGVLLESKRSAEFTHNHINGVIGAQATALVIWYARQGLGKSGIQERLEEFFGCLRAMYDEASDWHLNFSLDEIRPGYKFHVSCQKSVPQAIKCFLDSCSFEDAIRLAISLGGDSDTLAAITGGMAHAYYCHPSRMGEKGISEELQKMVVEKLPLDLLQVVVDFCEGFPVYGCETFIKEGHLRL